MVHHITDNNKNIFVILHYIAKDDRSHMELQKRKSFMTKKCETNEALLPEQMGVQLIKVVEVMVSPCYCFLLVKAHSSLNSLLTLPSHPKNSS